MDSKAISKKLISGSLLRITLLVCTIGASFYLVPFLVHALGDRMNGVWVLTGRFIGYYGVLDLGLASAVSRFASRAYGQNDYDEINRVFNTSLALFGLIGLVALAISFLLALLCPYFVKDPHEIILFKKVILILGVSLAIGFPARSFMGVLYSKLRYDLMAGVDLLKLLVRTALIIYFIKAGNGILALAIITCSVELMGYAAYLRLLLREFEQIKFSLALVKLKTVKTLFRYSVFTFIQELADLLRFRVDEFVIAGSLGVGFVTHYFIGTRLIELFSQFMGSALGMMTPVFSQFEGRSDMHSVRKTFLEVSKISVILAVFVGASLILYGKVFIERWMGPGYHDSYYVLLILCIPMTLGLAQSTSYGLFYGISKHYYLATLSACEGIANLILSLILVRYYGIYGVALGTSIPLVIVKLFFQPFYVCHVIDVTWKEYLVDTLFVPAVKTLAPVLGYWLVVRSYLIPSYLNIFFIAGLSVTLFIPVCYFLILSPSQHQLIRSHMFHSKEAMPAITGSN
jgi:O-antigen/teichoic acid export membrane protein